MNFDKEQFKAAVQRRLTRDFSKDIEQNDTHDIYDAVAASVLAEVMKNWMKTRSAYDTHKARTVYYLSAEFLMGRALGNNIIN